MAMDEELGRFHIQLFSHVFADFDQCITALTTTAGLGFMAMFYTRQMLG
jgi:hypothetical protein